MDNLWVIGANSEIAQQMVLAFHGRQVLEHLTLASRNLEHLNRFVFRHGLEEKADIRYVDLTDRHSIESFVQEADAPDGIIVCAGYLYSKSPIDYEQLRNVMDTNLNGVIYLLELALPALRRNKGMVAVFSSTAGEQGAAENKYYAAAKAGLNIYMEGFCRENAKFGMRTIVFKPGYVQTKMLRKKDGISKLLTISPQTAAKKCTACMLGSGKSLTIFVPFYWKWILVPGRIRRVFQ